jgi:hypothetical protein
MRTFFLTALASFATASLWYFTHAHNIRARFHMASIRDRSPATAGGLRRGSNREGALCQHCGMNEATHLPRLCAYCYWNLPGSRVKEYLTECVDEA